MSPLAEVPNGAHRRMRWSRPLARAYSRVTAGPGSILCFHSITSDPMDAGAAHVAARTLRMAVDAARDAGTLVPLRELVSRHQQGRSTRGLTALTFDDAYAALLSPDVAFLRTENIPVTVFVTTDAAETGSAFWWDRVDELFMRAPRERWQAFERACGLPDAFRNGQPPHFGPLRPLRQWMLHAYRGRSPAHVDEALAKLEAELGFRTAQRTMTFAELAAFAASPAVDLAVHTCSHPVLPLLADEELATEVAGCYATLRERFPNTVPVLAAPFGLFDARSITVARRAGMQATLTLAGRTLHGALGEDCLPRFCMCAGETEWKLLLRLAGLMERWHSWRDGPGPAFPDLPSAST